MCIIYLAFDHVPEHPLILLANRDEYYDRPSEPAGFWDDFPDIYAGRDLIGGGTWLGVTKAGRFAAVTNFREPAAPMGSKSRGNLVADFLKTNARAKEYLSEIEKLGPEYPGFNLLVGEIGERKELFYYSNRGDAILELSSGVYGLSNHLLDTPWPKVVRGKRRFAELLDSGDLENKRFFELLSEESAANDEDLPSTGVSFEIEKALSAIFIKTPGYGTRCSTVLKFIEDREWDFEETVFV